MDSLGGQAGRNADGREDRTGDEDFQTAPGDESCKLLPMHCGPGMTDVGSACYCCLGPRDGRILIGRFLVDSAAGKK